jgi:hypothetical protein
LFNRGHDSGTYEIKGRIKDKCNSFDLEVKNQWSDSKIMLKHFLKPQCKQLPTLSKNPSV